MEIIVILLIALVAFDIAAFLWGFNSCDGIDSPEWERRQHSRTLYESPHH
jgi:hypothetical protein